MGISVTQWRAKIGCFTQRSPVIAHPRNAETCNFSMKSVFLISMLLIIGCVELNPGPPKRDSSRAVSPSPVRDGAGQHLDKLDRIISTLDILASDNKRLENKLDSFTVSINSRLDSLKTEIDVHDVKLGKLNADISSNSTMLHNNIKSVASELTALKAEFDTFKSGHSMSVISTFPAVPSTSASPTCTIATLAKEISARNSRRNNIIISGLPPDSSRTDDICVQSLCVDELHVALPDIDISSFTCKRIGKKSATQALLVSFANGRIRDFVLSNARILRSSASAIIKNNVFISPDLTNRNVKNNLYSEKKNVHARRVVKMLSSLTVK